MLLGGAVREHPHGAADKKEDDVTPMTVSQILLWVVVILQGVVIMALARQVGVLHERIAPAGALMKAGGPGVGEKSPRIEVHALAGNAITIGGELAPGRASLMLFAQFELDERRFVNGPEVGMTYHVDKLPYAVLLDEAGVIASKGLVNSREHFESLVVAKESGYSTIQAYLKARSEAA
jgi:hypothetical protein